MRWHPSGATNPRDSNRMYSMTHRNYEISDVDYGDVDSKLISRDMENCSYPQTQSFWPTLQ